MNEIKSWAIPSKKGREVLETLIPELAESEDEKMINELQGFLDSFGADYFGTGEWQKFHDWLEKQKEQKPAEWSEDIEQAAARYERENRQSVLSSVDIVNAFIEGARWQEGRR